MSLLHLIVYAQPLQGKNTMYIHSSRRSNIAFQRPYPLPHLNNFILLYYPGLPRTVELHRSVVVQFKLAVGLNCCTIVELLYNSSLQWDIVFTLKYYLLMLICLNFNYFKIWNSRLDYSICSNGACFV